MVVPFIFSMVMLTTALFLLPYSPFIFPIYLGVSSLFYLIMKATQALLERLPQKKAEHMMTEVGHGHHGDHGHGGH